MADKTLKITFSGINILTPAETDAATGVVHVVMPAHREGTPGIAAHKAFVYAPEKYLVDPPVGADGVPDEVLGFSRVYHVDHARVVFEQPKSGPPQYFIDDKDLGERPGPSNIASADDMRWVVALRDVVPAAGGLAPDCDPTRMDVSDKVAMTVSFRTGMFRANFPCATVQPQVFVADGLRLDLDRRVYAQEFVVELSYPEDTGDLTLRFEPLRGDAVPTGVDGRQLVLRWVDGKIELRMGNDTASEIQALLNLRRCDIPDIPRIRDNDFILHYPTIDLADGLARPIPMNGTLHTEHNGCLGVRI